MRQVAALACSKRCWGQAVRQCFISALMWQVKHIIRLGKQHLKRTGALEVLFPKPDDVLYLPHEGTNKTLAHRLAPASLRAGEGCDLPHDKLLPVFLQCESKAKPAEGPAFWRLE